MIINHNLGAMNANRNMGINAANANKSMEKLSSGLRINKAGDDAAGLAISEKMRGQIRGLDQASANSQDAISMISTGEGALSETTSILQRMKELATQGANGTNTDTDREAIQNEFTQLTSEINRIGNTTEFNTQKLLQGSNSKSSVGATATAGTAAVDSVNATPAVFNTGAFSAVFANGDDFTLSFKGVTLTVNNEASSSEGVVAGTTGTAATVNVDTAATTALTDQLDVLVAGFNAAKAVAGSPLADFTIAKNSTNDGLTITNSSAAGATDNAEVITFTNTGAQTMTNTTNLAQNTTLGVTAVAGVAQTNDLTFDTVPTEGSTVTVAGKNVAFYDSSKTTFSSAADAATKLGASQPLGATDASYVVDISGKGTSDIASAVAALDFSATSSAGATALATGNKITFTSETAGIAAASKATVTTADAYAGRTSLLTSGTAANTDLSAKAFAMTVTVGSKIFTVDTTATGLKTDFNTASVDHLDTFGSAGQTTVIDTLKNATAADGTKLSDLVDVSFTNGTNQRLTLDAKSVGTDNISITVTGTDAGDANTALGLDTSGVTAGAAGTAAITDGGKEFTQTFQVGANQGQSFSISVNDMRSEALDIAGTSAGAAHDAVDGAKYLSVKSVTNGTDATNTEFALDVSTSTTAASAAIKVIDDAINSVSAERAKLGAYTNRLEHTIANLGTSSENLTSAESRIRDVDMAKEMSTFSKNNILNQAAQAMLAQANQQPQQVLQLLR